MSDRLDPTTPPAPALNRRVFVTLAAGAAATVSPISAALAAGEGFGRAHPPIVAESDPAIVVERPQLTVAGGPLPAYAAAPKNARATTPGVVVVQAIWGIDAQLRDVVRRFAKEGFVAIAPALYARSNPPDGDGLSDYTVFRPMAAALVDAQVDTDLAGAAQWIRDRAGRLSATAAPNIGVTGFCMGGGIAIRQSVDNTGKYSALASWYGPVRYGQDQKGPITPMALAYADDVKMPFLGNYGARDTGILAADVRALQALLKVPNDIKIYDEAGHAFFDDTRSAYVASAAADAWTRTLAWFRTYLV